MWRDLFKSGLDLIYPAHCLACHRPYPRPQAPAPLCASCRSQIQANRPPFCVHCSRHLPGPLPNARCYDCSHFHPEFDFAWGACLFKPPLRGLLHAFKYHQKTQLRHLLAQLMRDFVTAHHLDVQQFDGLVPMPLHTSRQRARGYNQSALLAQSLAQAWGRPLRPRCLRRVRATPSQTALNQKERWTNIQGAFRIPPSMDVRGRTFLIIDDLLTTGATASAAAGTLKEAGAKTVGIFTVAIAE